jgi:hypothetical protein
MNQLKHVRWRPQGDSNPRYRRERGFVGLLALFGQIRRIEDNPLISRNFEVVYLGNCSHGFGAVCAPVSPHSVPGFHEAIRGHGRPRRRRAEVVREARYTPLDGTLLTAETEKSRGNFVLCRNLRRPPRFFDPIRAISNPTLSISSQNVLTLQCFHAGF